MRDTETTFRLIKELTEEIAEKAEPLWAWWAIHHLACDALGLTEVTPAGIEWGLAKLKELQRVKGTAPFRPKRRPETETDGPSPR